MDEKIFLLYYAIARIDDTLIDDLISKRTKANQKSNAVVLEEKHKSIKRTLIFTLPATAIAVVVIVSAILVSLSNITTPTTPENVDCQSTDTDYTGNENNSNINTDNSGNEDSSLPPWDTNELHLTSVIFNNKSLLNESTAKSMQAYSVSTGIIGVETENVLSADKNRSENFSISIRPSTKISAFSGSSLIKVNLKEGEHADCDSVWYNIRKDETVCLSCLIREKIKATSDYIDACIRAAIEGGMISKESYYAGEIEREYEQLYQLLDTDTAHRFFSSGNTPTIDLLELTGTFADSPNVKKALEGYSYPRIHVIEYGRIPDRCLYILTDYSSDLAYGVFLFDFNTDNATRLDDSHVGEPSCYNGLQGINGMRCANLALATELYINDDYTQILAEVPYLICGVSYDEETGDMKPAYSASTIVVYNITGERFALLDLYGETDPISYAPCGGLIEIEGTISFACFNGKTGFSLNGENVFFIEGERLHLLKDHNGVPVVLMRRNGYTEGYRLYKNGAVLMDIDELYALSKKERSILIDSTLTDLVSGEKEAFFDNDVLAYTISKTGRYAYFYLGDGGITCIDLENGERGFLPLDTAFEEKTHGLECITFCLFLNSREDELLLAYYKDGELTFDRNAYYDSFNAFKKENHIYSMAANAVSSFNHNFASVANFFRVDGNPVELTQQKNAFDLARFFSVQVLDRQLTVKTSQTNHDDIIAMTATKEFLADVAETLIPYMDYTESTTYINATVLQDVRIPVFIFNERYDDLFSRIDKVVYVSNNQISDLEEYKYLTARHIANNIVRRITGYLSPDDSLRDNILLKIQEAIEKKEDDWVNIYTETLKIADNFYAFFNENIDKESADAIRIKLIDCILPILPEAHKDRTGATYAINQLELWYFYESIWNTVFQGASDSSYSDYLSSGLFLDFPYVGDFFTGRTAIDYGSIFLDSDRAIEMIKMKELLNELIFTSEEVVVSRDAAIFSDSTPFIIAGRNENDDPYLVSYGHSAQLTEEQYKRFVDICHSDIIANSANIDNATYSMYDAELSIYYADLNDLLLTFNDGNE